MSKPLYIYIYIHIEFVLNVFVRVVINMYEPAGRPIPNFCVRKCFQFAIVGTTRTKVEFFRVCTVFTVWELEF